MAAAARPGRLPRSMAGVLYGTRAYWRCQSVINIRVMIEIILLSRRNLVKPAGIGHFARRGTRALKSSYRHSPSLSFARARAFSPKSRDRRSSRERWARKTWRRRRRRFPTRSSEYLRADAAFERSVVRQYGWHHVARRSAPRRRWRYV